MNAAHGAVGFAAMAFTVAAALLGAWCWWQVRTTAWFWRALRASQAVIIVDVVLGGVDYLVNRKAPGLHILYGVLPLLVSLIAEQLRIASAQMVLDARGHASGKEVAALPAEEQRVVVLSILQREIAVMTLAALVNIVLLWRAAATA
jgi:hypothetical protein